MASPRPFLKRLLLGFPIICLVKGEGTPEAYLRAWAFLCAFFCIFMSLFIIFETITYILSGETFCIMFKTNSKNEDYQTEDSQTEDSQTEE